MSVLQDHIKAIALEIDRTEADLRMLEHRLYSVRARLAKLMNLRKGDYGFVEEPPNAR